MQYMALASLAAGAANYTAQLVNFVITVNYNHKLFIIFGSGFNVLKYLWVQLMAITARA
jgi:hypothetical protein